MYIIKMECCVQKVCEPLRQGKKTQQDYSETRVRMKGILLMTEGEFRRLVNSGAVMRRPLVSGFLVVTNMIQDRSLIHFSSKLLPPYGSRSHIFNTIAGEHCLLNEARSSLRPGSVCLPTEQTRAPD